MSQTLGEKLRQAREERGMTISEVAEQTRISALYLENIENDDYRILPGGIFNKGFVKSFAKTVGIDEQEALQDYARLAANASNQIVDEPKTYRPEVLTDERNSSSNLPTIIIAVLILGLMTWGVLTLVKYIQDNPTQPTANTNVAANINSDLNTNVALPNTNTTQPTVASMNNLKVEFKAEGDDIYLSSSTDGKPRSEKLMKSGDTLSFEPKEKLTLSFARERVGFARLTLNGKSITLPQPPAKGRVVLEINNENLGRISESGQIDLSAPSAAR